MYKGKDKLQSISMKQVQYYNIYKPNKLFIKRKRIKEKGENIIKF